MELKRMTTTFRCASLAFGLAAFALAACSGDDNTTPVPPPPDAGAKDGGPDATTGVVDGGDAGSLGDVTTIPDVGFSPDSPIADAPSPSDAGSDGAVAPAPGASLVCPSSVVDGGDGGGLNAWQTYGAPTNGAAFLAVNDAIFANVLADLGDAGTTHLGTSFTKIGSGNPASTMDDLPTFKANLAAFLVYAYGGPATLTITGDSGTANGTFVGPQDMIEAHTGLGITSDQYNYFVNSIVVPALTSSGVTSADVGHCFAPVLTDPNFMASIVGH